jgi:hypothetical protein
MNLHIRRALVVAGVVVSLVAGAVSIRVAAALAEAATPPPAPPVSIEMLQADIAAEQARAASLQQQLDELLTVTDDLTALIGTTDDQVTTDGLTARQLRDRLKAAQAKLATLTQLLKAAQARLGELHDAAVGGGGGSAAGAGAATPRPTAETLSLSLRLVTGGVSADWSTCHTAGFAGYAVVRSIDKEVHWPPETGDTEFARIGSQATTAATDTGAPSGSLTYRVFCLAVVDRETKVVGKSGTESITVP